MVPETFCRWGPFSSLPPPSRFLSARALAPLSVVYLQARSKFFPLPQDSKFSLPDRTKTSRAAAGPFGFVASAEQRSLHQVCFKCLLKKSPKIWYTPPFFCLPLLYDDPPPLYPQLNPSFQLQAPTSCLSWFQLVKVFTSKLDSVLISPLPRLLAHSSTIEEKFYKTCKQLTPHPPIYSSPREGILGTWALRHVLFVGWGFAPHVITHGHIVH